MYFVFNALDSVPTELKDTAEQQRILDELVGNFLPKRILETTGEGSLRNYYKTLEKLLEQYPELTNNNKPYQYDKAF